MKQWTLEKRVLCSIAPLRKVFFVASFVAELDCQLLFGTKKRAFGPLGLVIAY